VTVTTAGVDTIPPLEHAEAMDLAAAEYDRFLDLIRSLGPEDWTTKVDDCPLWDVRALVAHLLGNVEATARVREGIRQQVATKRRAKRTGESEIDAMTAVQVEARVQLSPDELTERLSGAVVASVRSRRRIPAFVRAFAMTFPPPLGKQPIGYLLDIIYTRDTWMHRVDVSRAVGRELVLTPEHDGRLVADVVAEWARLHGQPFELTLTGPAGGRWSSGTGGEAIETDAVEF
jgi:uncharacterized protein (TIGR03083 family)